ncbi:Rhodanese-like domain-containing protein [Panaeolus papilionaceus]|nr:Rhodanese-like domain-containing protein [Panaeolus papilionaceus]
MSSSAAPLLLSAKQAFDLQKSAGSSVSILDATWFMPNSPRKSKQEFIEKRLPGAQFLDLDEVASPNELGLKHMMPDSQTFAHACEQFGLSPNTHVILYDAHGVFSSPRALFMFRSFGHDNSSIINGGLPQWVEDGLPIESGAATGDVQRGNYPPPKFNDQAIRSYEQIVSNSKCDLAAQATTELVLDARPGGRFKGIDPEPRPNLSSGHMPNSFSLPFNLFLEKHKNKEGQEYSTFLHPDKVKKALEDAVGTAEASKIISGERPVVTSCGSGMTAGVLWLGLKLLGVKQIGLYDESWTGYAMRPSSKIEKSAA